MGNLGRVLVSMIIVATSATVASAEMPKELKGSWILDAQATQKYVKTSPKWKAEDEKHLPMIIKRMSQMQYKFTDDAIVMSMRGREQVIPVSLKKSDAKKYVFDGKLRGQDVTMTVFFMDDATINIRSSATDDMDYYLWKRGSLASKEGPSDKSLATEMMQKALENTSN